MGKDGRLSALEGAVCEALDSTALQRSWHLSLPWCPQQGWLCHSNPKLASMHGADAPYSWRNGELPLSS